MDRETDLKLGILILFRLHLDMAMVIQQNLPAEIEPYSGRLRRGLGREEGIENLSDNMRVDTVSIVIQPDLHLLVLLMEMQFQSCCKGTFFLFLLKLL